ncbi:MAG: orotidine-5'-phosphate decarboxylase [Magnetococcales bacterium]|nr:orotidine-5'-phosphate decarboxylase [Magnetococcales bacterium]NGZ25453.1 orotidine-5'-phosphate decarboxylase [Magnetococcales bacterium]
MRKPAIPLDERIIFALDLPTAALAKEWVLRLESRVKFFKVGLQLFLAEDSQGLIDWIRQRGCKVMLDLKFFDVPETVKLAVAQVANLGATFITVHGNEPIIRAAVESRGESRILAVTVLTSFGLADMEAMGMTASIEDFVYWRAKRAIDAGCDGVVSSGLEAARLRKEMGDHFYVVTPGIRPGANVLDDSDDQKRIVTARQAILNGADHVVVGRPIRNAADPLAVVAALQEEIRSVSP